VKSASRWWPTSSTRSTRAYGVEHPDAGVALRGSFLIDKNGVVQHQVVNNLPLGREVDELLRLIDALQFTEEYGEVCRPAGTRARKGMKPTAAGVASYLASTPKRCERCEVGGLAAWGAVFPAARQRATPALRPYIEKAPISATLERP